MDTMAIAGMAMGLQAAKLQEAVGTSVLKMQMDTSQDAALRLIDGMMESTQTLERSVNPHLGKNIDILA